jgi:hypothetical protein
MRDETAAWLEPMVDEIGKRDDIYVAQLMRLATMPVWEVDNPSLDWVADFEAEHPGVRHAGFDWIRFGCLLRSKLGWDDTYPAFPDVPEWRDVP